MIKQSQISYINLLENGEFNEAWRLARLSKITSSQVWKLCNEKKGNPNPDFNETGMSYIRTRVFEKISKVTSDREISTVDTINGLVEEGLSLRHFMKVHGVEATNFFVFQKLIHGIDPLYSCTPDGIWVRKMVENPHEERQYESSPIESKSYSVIRHMACVECTTSAEIREVDYAAYIQLLDQMIICGCLTGWLIYWNQALPPNKGGYREIEFRQVDPVIRADVKYINTRKEKAKLEIDRIYNKLIA